jgi:hypothetical protein
MDLCHVWSLDDAEESNQLQRLGWLTDPVAQRLCLDAVP